MLEEDFYGYTASTPYFVKDNITAVALGEAHSLILSSLGKCFGCGRIFKSLDSRIGNSIEISAIIE